MDIAPTITACSLVVTAFDLFLLQLATFAAVVTLLLDIGWLGALFPLIRSTHLQQLQQ
jgi:hypothetical protein